jgi:very-short-patch-repair endonuclease
MNEWWIPLLAPDGLLLRDRALLYVDPDQLLIALRSGRLRRVQRGVYIPRNLELLPVTAARAAILSSGIPKAVASHETAARVHGLALPGGRRREHVTVQPEKRRKDRKDLKFHIRGIALGDTISFDGIPVTTVQRTLLDLACLLDRLPAVWAIDEALRQRRCTREAIGQALAMWRGGTGSRSARIRLAESDGLSESILETAARLTLADARLPPPVAQFEVHAPDGRLIARLDHAYPFQRVALEYDGRSVHEAPTALYRDRDRQNVLVALGWTVLRFTWWDVVEDPARFAQAVAGVLTERGARLSS